MDKAAFAARFVGFGLAVSLSGWATRRCGRLSALPRSPLAPPPWVFGVVWPILYATTGLVWAMSQQKQPRFAVDVVMGSITLLCCAWLVVFLCARSKWAAVAVLAFVAALSWTSVGVVPGDWRWLMLPLAAWTTFATVLNTTSATTQP